MYSLAMGFEPMTWLLKVVSLMNTSALPIDPISLPLASSDKATFRGLVGAVPLPNIHYCICHIGF